MSDAEAWLLLFVLGVVLYMAGALVPARVLALVGVVVALVGGIGTLIVAVS